MIENQIKKVKGESAIVTLTKKRIRLNLNMFCMFTGKLGSGKSWSAISYALELDPDFDVDKQVVFDFKQTMNLINSEEFQKRKMKVIVWDEPQITISNRAWQSQMNKLVNYLISTFRHQNIILVMAAPYKDFLDTQTMKLLIWEFQCSSIDRKTKECLVYPKYQQYNPQKKKIYPHCLFVIKNNKQYKTPTWKILKPPKEAVEIYELNKTKFTTKLNRSIQDTLDKIDDKDEDKDSILNKGSAKSREAKRLYIEFDGDTKKVAKELGITPKNVNVRLGRHEKRADLDDFLMKMRKNLKRLETPIKTPQIATIN